MTIFRIMTQSSWTCQKHMQYQKYILLEVDTRSAQTYLCPNSKLMLKLVLTITLIFHTSLNSNSRTKSNSSQSLNSNFVQVEIPGLKTMQLKTFWIFPKKPQCLKLRRSKLCTSIKHNALELYIIPNVLFVLLYNTS